MNKSLLTGLLLGSAVLSAQAQKSKTSENDNYAVEKMAEGLSFRSIGPAVNSGRIADIAVNPKNHSEYFIAVASGGVWKTTNAGTTFTPVMDEVGVYSFSCVTYDPINNNVIWVGSGENNNQRSVAYGNGVYKSVDGGKSWENMGLETSEHIGNIVIHPNNPDIVYVSAYGPLWKEGSERGIYQTKDGGKTWSLILEVDENTGFNEIHMDPSNPDILIAAAHQRRRHVYTYVGGGPSSGLYKSKDGGATWYSINKGLPGVDKGRIGLAISPVNDNYYYAIVEASSGKGFYKSTDKGESWVKQSSYSTSGNYYQELVPSPHNADVVYAMDTWLHHTENGGKKFIQTGEDLKHVDNHCMWIDPNDANHWRVGCDGGLYETWDAAKTWQYKANLPLTQFYKLAVDNAYPFYNVYGGTQDNNTQGGPAQTRNNAGIANSDWFIVNGGDGFQPKVDPSDPNTVYAESQYGWLVRYDKETGQRTGIKPQPMTKGETLTWNWDSPLLISHHDNSTLYFCSDRVFKSTDKGDHWVEVSGDLTRDLDRTKMKVMGRTWGPDAVMYNKSTTQFGNIVAFDESKVQDGLLYAGTDDGLIQVFENGAWNKIEEFEGVPDMTYVMDIETSKHDANTVYAVFNNHKNGDFKPYILKSENKGKDWTNVSGDLPEAGAVYCMVEDKEDPNLLFAGTEFGAFFSTNGGTNWYQINRGIPTIAVRDMVIQERESDLVVATFGRGFYVLDNFSALRNIQEDAVIAPAHIFEIATAYQYVPSNPLGLRGRSMQGHSYYVGKNPTFGASFDVHVTESYTTLKAERQKAEKEELKQTGNVSYPPLSDLRKEDRESSPYFLFIIKDSEGNEVNRIKTSTHKGLKRYYWNLRYQTTSNIRTSNYTPGRYGSYDVGPMAIPGEYSVELWVNQNGVFESLVAPTKFEVKALDSKNGDATTQEELLSFQLKVAEMKRSLRGNGAVIRDLDKQITYMKSAINTYPGVPLDLSKSVAQAEAKLDSLKVWMYGDNSASSREFASAPGISSRLEIVAYNIWSSNAALGESSKESVLMAEQEYADALKLLAQIKAEMEALNAQLNELKIPYTPGRQADFKQE